MYPTGVKTRQAPVVTTLPKAKRSKLDTQTLTTRSATSNVMKRSASNITTASNSRITTLRATTNSNVVASRNATKSKFTEKIVGAPTALPFVNNQLLKSLKSSRDSNSKESFINGKPSMMPKKDSKKELDIKLSSVRRAPVKKSNDPPLFGDAFRSQPTCSTSSIGPNQRLWNRNKTNPSLQMTRNKDPCKDIKSFETPSQAVEMGVQTQEQEILNPSLLIGDIKLIKPSKHIIDEIEKLRKDFRTRKLLKATRTFEEHSERQEEHLTDLKEFLDKSYVTKRQRKSRDSFEEERNTMDQLLNRAIPKTESITDIKARIKRKEQELLSLFDNVESTARLLANTN